MASDAAFADVALRRLMNRSLFADVAELGRLCPGPYSAILAEFKTKTGQPHALEWIKLVEDEDFSAASDSLQALTVGSDNAPSNKTFVSSASAPFFCARDPPPFFFLRTTRRRHRLNSIARMCLHLAEPEDAPKTQSLIAILLKNKQAVYVAHQSGLDITKQARSVLERF